MNSTTYRFKNRARLTASLLVTFAAVLGSLVACSSDENPKPGTPPVVTTGGGGHGGGGDEDAGESSVGGSNGGTGNKGGSANGGSGDVEEGGSAGEGGEAGEGPISPTCPTTDLGFLNQPTKSQKAPFDNSKRLGAAAALPPLP